MDAQTKLTMAQSELKSLQSKMSSQSQLVTSLEDTLDENMEQITLLQTRLIEDTQRLREEVEQVREEGRARVAAIAEEIEGYKARMVELVEAAKVSLSITCYRYS